MGSRIDKWLSSTESPLDASIGKSMDNSMGEMGVSAERFERMEQKYIASRRSEQEKARSEMRRIRNWSDTKGSRARNLAYRIVSVVFCLVLIAFLLMTVSNLPSFGDASNPMNNEVSQRYLEDGLEEGGATNLVADMILDYRAFDTLGESNVLFIAVCSVIILLRVSQGERNLSPEKLIEEENDRLFEPNEDTILQVASRLVIPFILLFGIYIVLNGHLSPGGGFSGGAILGAGLILYLNAYGFTKTERFFTFKTFKIVSLCALSFYAVSKAYSFFTGANGLGSFIGTGKPGAILSAGLILPLNIAVGLVVACTMYAFFTLFRKGDM